MTRLSFPDTVTLARQIQGWMGREEMEWLYTRAGDIPEGGVWLEMGVWKGRSFLATAMGLTPGATIIGVDTFRGSPESMENTHREALDPAGVVLQVFQRTLALIADLRPDIAARLLQAESQEAARQMADQSLDACFIDGSHTHAAFTADLAAWVPKVKPGGVLCGHDANHPGVKQGLHEQSFKVGRPETGGSIWIRETTL